MPLKWHYPVGLLYDLYAGADPATKGAGVASTPLVWRLTVHFSDWPDEELVRLDPDGMVMNDAFINSVKEADFLRNGTAKGIMTLSKEDSSGLWKAVEESESIKPTQPKTKLILTTPSRPHILPTNFQHPPPPAIPTLPQRPHPNLPPPPTRLRLPFSKSSPISPPTVRANILAQLKPDSLPRQSKYSAPDHWDGASLSFAELVSQSPDTCPG